MAQIIITCQSPDISASIIQEHTSKALRHLGIATTDCDYSHRKGGCDVNEDPYPLVVLPDTVEMYAYVLSQRVNNIVYAYTSNEGIRYFNGQKLK